MKKYLVIISILLPVILIAQPLPDFYHTYDEVIDSLLVLESMYPEVMDVFEIGISQQDSVPIYAVKLSDNVQIKEDEARLLFVGQVHAEENIGVEIVLDIVTELVSQWYISPTRYYFELSEMFFVPSFNPEGMNVVLPPMPTSEQDASLRKNKRDNVGDGLFRFQLGVGFDSSGVDLNRNFSLNWIHGDTLWQGGSLELYDYYRGPAPFSESETQAVRDLSEENNFCLAIIFHQSRTGNVSENVIYPWEWEPGKTPPDFDAIDYIGVQIAQQLQLLENPGQHYAPHGASGRTGKSQDWFYAALNCYQYTIETSSIQPANINDLNFIVEDNEDAILYLIRRAIGFGAEISDKGQLTGNITDSVTGQPLAAEVKLVDRQSGYLQPRYSDEDFGRYRFILNQGSYHLQISKPWYAVIDTVIPVSQNYITTRDFQLNPLPVRNVSGTVFDYQLQTPVVNPQLCFSGNLDTIITGGADGYYTVDLPQGIYTLRIENTDYVSYFEDLVPLFGDRVIDRELSPAEEIFSDGFESGAGSWVTGGNATWDVDLMESHSGNASLADSPGEMYADNISSYARFEADLTSCVTAHLEFWHKYYLEPECDFGYVDISADGGTEWQQLAYYDLQDIDWKREVYSLTSYCGNTVQVRFTIETDGIITESGWNIDEVLISGSDSMSSVEDEQLTPLQFNLERPYPNPFNSRTLIRYSIPHPGKVEMVVYNSLGRKINTIFSGYQDAGNRIAYWNADNLSSGMYIIRLSTEKEEASVKALLIK